MSPYEARWDDVGGRRVRSLRADTGSHVGPPVVLIPGLGALGYLIDTLLGCSARCQSFLVDVPGFGYRGPKPCAPEVPAITDLVCAWLRSVPSRPVVLFGHSTGAQVALRVAASAPESVAGLVLAGPTFPHALRTPRALVRAFSRNSRYEPPGLIPVTWPYYLRGGPRPLMRYIRSAQRDEPEQLIGSIACPVTVLRGRYDAFSTDDWCRELVRAARDGQLVTVPGAHTFPFRRAGLTTALIAQAAQPVSDTTH